MNYFVISVRRTLDSHIIGSLKRQFRYDYQVLGRNQCYCCCQLTCKILLSRCLILHLDSLQLDFDNEFYFASNFKYIFYSQINKLTFAGQKNIKTSVFNFL